MEGLRGAARRALELGVLVALVSCSSQPKMDPPLHADPPQATVTPIVATKVERDLKLLDRATFNKLATRLNVPIYWTADVDGDGAPDPDEIVSLLFFSTSQAWVEEGRFTPAFEVYYDRLVEASKRPAATGDDAARQNLVTQELDNASSVLVATKLRAASNETREVVRRVLRAARAVDDLYARQLGITALAAKIPGEDLASQSLFRRNWGPSCATPGFDKNAACTGIAGMTKVPVDVYPVSLQKKETFCKDLEKRPDAKALLTPFSVVREEKGKLVAVPYNVAYLDGMKRVSDELKSAAEAVKDPTETAFKDYLLAAAKSFESNDWGPADEAWAKMNSRNSKYYLRIAPDETYWEPCSQKAGFHVSFALINTESLELQDKLTPLQQQMEDALAKLIGPPYKPRQVSFHLPDFIDIVFNAGDSRDAVGGTIGQSLPNWGAVANEGRGRTVAMNNLYTDPDSMKVRRAKAESILAAETAKVYEDNPKNALLGTVLHEATHNLGPSHEYTFKGQKDDQAFGGDLASMLEELKSQTGGLYFVDFIQKKGIIDAERAKKIYTDSILWALNHVSRGMYTAGGQRKAYSQLSAIQLGFLMDEGALVWEASAPAANGKDVGAFKIVFDKLPKAIEKMMSIVGAIKAKNDRTAALDLAKKYVDGARVPQKIITERMLRFPQPNFVYAIDW